MDCRFKFSKSYCAHKSVVGARCKGHDACEHFSPPYGGPPMRITDVAPVRCVQQKLSFYFPQIQKLSENGLRDP